MWGEEHGKGSRLTDDEVCGGRRWPKGEQSDGLGTRVWLRRLQDARHVHLGIRAGRPAHAIWASWAALLAGPCWVREEGKGKSARGINSNENWFSNLFKLSNDQIQMEFEFPKLPKDK